MNKKYNLFVYPNAKPHVHDNEEMHLVNGVSQYINTVPLSEIGIKNHFNLTTHEDADFFYMGQISDGMEIPNKENFIYLKDNEHKHICDIEGDWVNKQIPNWMFNCILTINGARKEYGAIKMFVRPTFSFLLVDLAKNKLPYERRQIDNISFGFRGYLDPYGVRLKMINAFNKSNLIGDVSITNVWMAQNDIHSDNAKKYINILTNNIFSLCPMGSGFDSIRFFESCYYGAIPIVISDIFVPFQKEFGKPFFFEIDYRLSEDEIKTKLIEITQTPIEIIKEMSDNAQDYFNCFIVSYFKDPTLTFLNWLSNE